MLGSRVHLMVARPDSDKCPIGGGRSGDHLPIDHELDLLRALCDGPVEHRAELEAVAILSVVTK